MKLLLTSTGLPNEIIRNKFLNLVCKDPKNIIVGFIPTAADPEEDKWFVDEALNQIKEMGMHIRIVDLKGKNEESLKEKLENCDVIYVNGGNTFYLLDWVRKSGFDKVIRPLLEEGKVYIGGSAGGLIAGPSIDVASWKGGDINEIGLIDFTGLNLVPFTIYPHYTMENATLLEEMTKKVDYKILPITNEQAVLINGDNVEIIRE